MPRGVRVGSRSRPLRGLQRWHGSGLSAVPAVGHLGPCSRTGQESMLLPTTRPDMQGCPDSWSCRLAVPSSHRLVVRSFGGRSADPYRTINSSFLLRLVLSRWQFLISSALHFDSFSKHRCHKGRFPLPELSQSQELDAAGVAELLSSRSTEVSKVCNSSDLSYLRQLTRGQR